MPDDIPTEVATSLSFSNPVGTSKNILFRFCTIAFEPNGKALRRTSRSLHQSVERRQLNFCVFHRRSPLQHLPRSREQCDKLEWRTYEWDAGKSAANLEKHGVFFEDSATVFIDPLATTFPDPDHSVQELQEVTIGYTMGQQLVFVSHCERRDRLRIIGARLATRPERNNMKKELASKPSDDMRQEYDLSQLRGGVRGKYYRRATAGTNLILIDPDLMKVFPDSESVNRALRLLADTAHVATVPKRRRTRQG